MDRPRDSWRAPDRTAHLQSSRVNSRAPQVDRHGRSGMADSITINTGAIDHPAEQSGGAARSPRSRSATRPIARNGKLICTLEDRSDYAKPSARSARRIFESQIDSVTVEQSGPVRAVVKITGKHQSTTGRSSLAAVCRAALFLRRDRIRSGWFTPSSLTATSRRISSGGWAFASTCRCASRSHNRHVRFAGETGIFAEPIATDLRNDASQPATRIRKPDCRRRQACPDIGRRSRAARLVKDTGGLGCVQTRCRSRPMVTRSRSARTPKAAGFAAAGGHTRRSGTAFIGDTTGGLACEHEEFLARVPDRTGNQKTPQPTPRADAVALVARFARDGFAPLRHRRATAWMRSYEDYQPGFSTPTGVARTNEMTFRAIQRCPVE